ncbi:MAG: hypothetical protein M9930_12095 [Anaerolineae bacterium]|nr:hypothetical protein [Anaerolineae bacterium]
MNQWACSERLLIIAHRGASADAPENTMRAFQLACEQGADGIEFDVLLSADAIPIVIHDDTLDRTTNGTGPVKSMTAAQLQQLDAGDGETIPTLDQVLDTFGRNWLLNIEIKLYGWFNRGCEKAVAAVIAKHNLADHVVVSSFDFRVMRRARRVMPPGVGLALLRDNSYTYTHRFFKGQFDHPHFTLVTEKSMDMARATGQRVNVWTVDDSAEAQRLQTLGVNALITNRPAALRTELGLT